MESLHGVIRQLEAWWSYSLRCAQSPGCDSTWTWVTIGAVVAALIGLAVLAKMYFASGAERPRVAEGARVADAQTMSQYRVDSDKFYAGSDQADTEQRIRQALAQRKAGDLP